MNYPHTATVQRKTKTGTIYDFSAYGSTPCFLQPLDLQSSVSLGLTYTKAFACYAPYDADVKENDRLTIDGTNYGVSGLRRHNYGTLKHTKLMLEVVT